ncbi:MAG: TerC family protein [Actinomycetes bacterium]|jgi:tellurite resistance protein TerC
MISASEWVITVLVLSGIIVFDLLVAIIRRNSETTVKESALWTIFYISLAILFGAMLPNWATTQAQGEFFAGWLTEYALSIDNIFVFVIILSRLKVPKEKQQLVLMIGILLTIAIRGLFIPAGATLIARFSSIFFLFGGFLIYTAYELFKESGEEDKEWKEGKIVTALKSKGASTFTIALVSLALTNVVFSLDSIPAIFGLTKDAYIVTTANIFALMGLRQLYFLIGGLLTKLVYLSKGLSVILGFIGVKLILEAFHGIGIHQIGGVHIPEISLNTSLFVIITCLIITTITSLIASSKSKVAE